MKSETSLDGIRPSAHAVLVPHEELAAEELDRRIEFVRERDNVGRGEAHAVALQWLQSETGSDLLSTVERGLYRIWYSRPDDNRHYREVAIWFEGTLYHWPGTSRWLLELIQGALDADCCSVGTFVRCEQQWEREALMQEQRTVDQKEQGDPLC